MLKSLILTNKKIYLAPKNNVTKLLRAKLISEYNIIFLGYIDTYKQNDSDVIQNNQLQKYDFIFIYSPNYYLDIIKNLPNQNIYIMYDKECNSIKYNKLVKYLPFFMNKYKSFLSKIYLKKEFFPFFLKEKFDISITKNISRINNLPNINQRVFIIGNGPSLKISDLDILQNDLTIAANKIFLAFDETKWRPNFYTIEDHLDLEEYYDEIQKYDLGIKFFPIKKNFRKMSDSIYYKQLHLSHFSRLKFSNNIVKGFYAGETVAMTMIQFAIAQGAKELYLIGFDNNYKEILGQEKHTFKISKKEQNHFHKDYRKSGDIWTEARVDNISIQFGILKQYCDKHNIKIYNASRQTKLDMFERVDFDSLF